MKKAILFAAILLSAMGVSAQQTDDTHGVTLPDADELHIMSTEEKVPAGANDSYMRIVLDRKVEADKWTLISFPAQLDGYYFGPDAERYKVTACDLATNPVTLQKEAMAALDDFQANQMYLVKSKGSLDKIVSMSPGVKTAVPKASDVTLICLTLDDVQDPTAVEGIKATDVKNAKQVYDLSGRLTKSVRSGIYIINGKKVFEK